MNILHHVGISGGKDSTALLLWLVRESGIDPKTILATFADTGNEHELTYAFLEQLHSHVHPIHTIKPPLDFFQLALKKGRFPSPRARFCTTDLKVKPTLAYLARLRARGWDKIVMCSGVRASESLERSLLVEREDRDAVVTEWRPLLRWTLADIWACHQRHGIEPNPLYRKGASRVGCFPCIMSKKAEIAAAYQWSPETFTKLRAAEQPSNWANGQHHGFFGRKMIPRRFHSHKVRRKDGTWVTTAGTEDVIRWALEKKVATTEGLPLTELSQDAIDANVCPSNLGYCD